MSTDGYTTSEHALHELRLPLDRIAKANGDEFGMTVEIAKGRHGQTVFELRAFEIVENHCFAALNAETITEAANAMRADLPASCAAWDYKFVE